MNCYFTLNLSLWQHQNCYHKNLTLCVFLIHSTVILSLLLWKASEKYAMCAMMELSNVIFSSAVTIIVVTISIAIF